jgi:hypothetical protein
MHVAHPSTTPSPPTSLRLAESGQPHSSGKGIKCLGHSCPATGNQQCIRSSCKTCCTAAAAVAPSEVPLCGVGLHKLVSNGLIFRHKSTLIMVRNRPNLSQIQSYRALLRMFKMDSAFLYIRLSRHSARIPRLQLPQLVHQVPAHQKNFLTPWATNGVSLEGWRLLQQPKSSASNYKNRKSRRRFGGQSR